MITSRITSKAQTTIPQPVRAALGLKTGDELVYEIQDGRVIITRPDKQPADDPFATFSEWDGEADRKAYAGF
jgi:antitoxin PrlF